MDSRQYCEFSVTILSPPYRSSIPRSALLIRKGEKLTAAARSYQALVLGMDLAQVVIPLAVRAILSAVHAQKWSLFSQYSLGFLFDATEIS